MGTDLETIEGRITSMLSQLQSECGILQRMVYKNKNQHRRCSYFQRLLKVRRDLRLLQSENLEELVTSCFLVIKGDRPKKKVHLLESEVSVLFAQSFFMGFSLTIMALLARLRVLVQQILLDVVSLFNTVSSLSRKKQSIKITHEGIEVFREFYPVSDDFVTLECVWKLDKFILLERKHKKENESQNDDSGGNLSVQASGVNYDSIESFLGGERMETRTQARMEGMDQRLAEVETTLSDLAAAVTVVTQGQQRLDQEMTEQAEFRKYIAGLVRRLEKIPPEGEERESPMTEVMRSRAGTSGDNSKRGAASETPKQPVSGARGVRHLTTQEWEERRKKGLCFRCGMPYNPLHKCADPKVRVVLLGEDEMTNEEGEVLVAEEMNPEIEDDSEEGECRMLEYLDMDELFQTQENRGELSSMKVEGQVGGIPILILLDSGTTHNFISPKLGVCQKLKVDIGGYGCLIDAYVLDIGGLDLILGVAWLRTLGDVIANWEKMTMSFQVSGQNFTLEGAVKPNQVVSSLHSIIHNPYFGSIQPDRKKGNCEVRDDQLVSERVEAHAAAKEDPFHVKDMNTDLLTGLSQSDDGKETVSSEGEGENRGTTKASFSESSPEAGLHALSWSSTINKLHSGSKVAFVSIKNPTSAPQSVQSISVLPTYV
ncbi:Aspartic peptidase domain superfamily [Sesbania bispinosa]|nr:Aspartic peptidase domain superfamily [Sesbania bispinosa]